MLRFSRFYYFLFPTLLSAYAEAIIYVVGTTGNARLQDSYLYKHYSLLV